MAYHFADWIAVREVNKYCDLNSKQKEFLAERVKYHLARGEKEEFPLYVALLEDIKSGLNRGLDQQIYLQLNEHYHQRIAYTLEKLLPDIGELLATLSPEQIDFLQKKLLRDNDEAYSFIELSPEKRKAQRQEIFLDSVKSWFGKLDKQQTQQIVVWHEEIPDLDGLWHDYTTEQINKFAAMLRKSPGSRAIADYLNQYWVNREDHFTPEFETLYQQQLTDVRNLIIRLDKLLKPKQRQRALERFDGYMDLLKDIAEQK